MKYYNILFLLLLTSTLIYAQPERWQQRAEYEMEIDFNVNKHQYEGVQSLTYYNNSPDTLRTVFYHLYFNAFQPNSMMDVRSRTIADPDPRVGARIQKLSKEEIGYQKVRSLKQNGKALKYELAGTVLEVQLAEPILPGSKALFEMEFEAQVPIQIRRSGRDNAEGIAYSMAQWYPKMAEYDYQGWHANPYVAREFHGIWGDFDVKITIDKDYIIGGTGYLQNPEEIGYGYTEEEEVKKSGKKLTWHFKAPNVHDFMWAADPDYTHGTYVRDNGMVIHTFYQATDQTRENWEKMPEIIDVAFDFINENYGEYPYRQYSFIQGGDGGMEYPMATLITGERTMSSLVGVSVHELMHSWYQMMLGTNESLYPWMDEGFTSWASSEVMNHLRREGLIPGKPSNDPHLSSYTGFINFARGNLEEPMSTHADHYVTNTAYSVASYVKGHIFLSQLEYIIGEKDFRSGMLRYFNTWKFKHPNVNDFIRIMEKESGLELDWYKEYFVNTTYMPDYAVEDIEATNDRKGTIVNLAKKGIMPMPLDIKVTYTSGESDYFNIPLRIMRGHKPLTIEGNEASLLPDWPWTHPTYQFELPVSPEEVQGITIDPAGRLVDANRDNNKW